MVLRRSREVSSGQAGVVKFCRCSVEPQAWQQPFVSLNQCNMFYDVPANICERNWNKPPNCKTKTAAQDGGDIGKLASYSRDNLWRRGLITRFPPLPGTLARRR